MSAGKSQTALDQLATLAAKLHKHTYLIGALKREVDKLRAVSPHAGDRTATALRALSRNLDRYARHKVAPSTSRLTVPIVRRKPAKAEPKSLILARKLAATAITAVSRILRSIAARLDA